MHREGHQANVALLLTQGADKPAKVTKKTNARSIRRNLLNEHHV